MELQMLYGIQNMHLPWLDQLMLWVTNVMGSYGQLWAIVGIALLLFRKTRKCGTAVLLSYILVLVAGHLVLKDLIARPRPCNVDETVVLLVARPASFSCPSTHSAWAFGAAAAIFCRDKRWGTVALVAATLIGFSRMYLFVHFPTDVLFGATLGVGLGLLSVRLTDIAEGKIPEFGNLL